MATGEITRARQTLLRLADTLGEAGPERTVLAPFRDDELCATLSGMSTEYAYGLAQQVLRHLVEAWKAYGPALGWLGILSMEAMLAKSAPRCSRR